MISRIQYICKLFFGGVFMQMRIGTKIGAGFAAMLVMVGLMAAIALYSLPAAQNQMEVLHETKRRLVL